MIIDLPIEPLEAIVILSAFAGAIHVLAPDHWIPTSVLSWRKRWGLVKTLSFSGLIFSFHVLLGFLIFLVCLPLLEKIDSSYWLAVSVAWVGLGAVIRWVRFSRARELLRSNSNWVWSVLTVVSLLGPCESIVPVFLKAKQMGVGYLLPFVAFSSGTLILGATLIVLGNLIWNRPHWWPRAMEWSIRRRALVPVVAGVAIGIGLLMKVVA